MEEIKYNGYELSRIWFNWSFDNPEKINPNHSALYFFCIEHCNRLGWKNKFGLPTEMAKEAIGIKNYRTYQKTLNDLINFGFLKMIQISKNQYSSNIIAIVKNTKAPTKALDKALQKHKQKQGKSIVSIDKQYNNITINNKQIEFDIFWNLYNKKIGAKEKCKNKWDNLKISEQEKIINTLPVFIKSIKEKKYQPYPETYLNQKRWNDEITEDVFEYTYEMDGALKNIAEEHKMTLEHCKERILKNENLKNILLKSIPENWFISQITDRLRAEIKNIQLSK